MVSGNDKVKKSLKQRLEDIGVWLALILSITSIVFNIFTLRISLRAEKKADYSSKPRLQFINDYYILDEYQLASPNANGHPKGIPSKTAKLENIVLSPVSDSNIKIYKPCLILNTSSKDSDSEKIECYTGFFGRCDFQVTGQEVRKIELVECNIEMPEGDLKSIDLKAEGCIDYPEASAPTIEVYLAYLYDHDEHCMINPKYEDRNSELNKQRIEAKRVQNGQLRSRLPHIVDNHRSMSTTFDMYGSDGHIYRQTIQVTIERYEDGEGMYIVKHGEPERL